jgi:hypothetical protein
MSATNLVFIMAGITGAVGTFFAASIIILISPS